MRRLLPLFPLRIVVFPGEKLQLHVFEPRYIQLINECLDAGATFGVSARLGESADDDGEHDSAECDRAEYGTEMRVLNLLSREDNGEMDVLTEGVSAFRLDQFVPEAPGKLYSAGYVTTLENDETASAEAVATLAVEFARFHELLDTGYARENFSGRNLSFRVAHEVGLPLERKIHLLACETERERLALLIEHLRLAIPLIEAAQEAKDRLRNNGHVTKWPPERP